MGWAYLMTGVVTFIVTTKIIMHEIAAREIHKRNQDSLWKSTAELHGWKIIDGSDLALAMVSGLVIGAFWPLAIVLGGLFLAFRGFTPKIERDYEQAQRDAMELEKLRRLAREHDLPMPDDRDGSAR